MKTGLMLTLVFSCCGIVFGFSNFKDAYRAALQKKNAGKLNDAKIGFKESLFLAKNDNDRARVYNHLGDIDVLEKKPDQAQLNYQRVIDLDGVALGFKIRAELAIAQIALGKDETERAMKICDKILKFNEDDIPVQHAGARLVRGAVLKKQGDAKAAKEEWEKVLLIDFAEDAQKGSALIEILDHLRKEKKHDEVIERSEEIFELDTVSDDQKMLVLKTVAAAHQGKGDVENEMKTYQKMVGLPGGDDLTKARACVSLGERDMKADRLDEAMKYFTKSQKVCRRMPLDMRSQVMLNQALINLKLKKKAVAKKQLQQIVKWGPKRVPYEVLKKAREEMAKLIK